MNQDWLLQRNMRINPHRDIPRFVWFPDQRIGLTGL
jgi:hypothetical protein